MSAVMNDESRAMARSNGWVRWLSGMLAANPK